MIKFFWVIFACILVYGNRFKFDIFIFVTASCFQYILLQKSAISYYSGNVTTINNINLQNSIRKLIY